jgi:hypothetical protein
MKVPNLLDTTINASLLVSVISLVAQPAAAGQQDFRFHNNTGSTIKELYVSPSQSGDWEEDVLGRDLLYSGQTTRIRFGNSNPNICSFDIKVVFTDESTVEKREFNLCRLTDVSIP